MAGFLIDTGDATQQRRTTVVRDQETGLPIIRTVQDTHAILDANKRASSDFDRYRARRAEAGMVRVASIPTVVVLQLKEAGIWDDPKALNKWLDQPENRHFRTDGGRRLS
jgi:hypothetical protein